MKMNKGKVLIVEDSPEVANILVRGLSEEGFAVGSALSGVAALGQFRNDWDVVILDLMLPDIQGETLLNFLAQRSNPPRVLVLSAKSLMNDKIALFRRGC